MDRRNHDHQQPGHYRNSSSHGSAAYRHTGSRQSNAGGHGVHYNTHGHSGGPMRSSAQLHGAPQDGHVIRRNYKLMVDPLINPNQGQTKIYRFEGVVEGETILPGIVVRDPRKQRLWISSETVDLPIPRFQIDSNYVCDPPPLEVTIFNVNDNIDKEFLYNEIVRKHQCGPVEELSIFNHEFLHKHLGVARLLFEDAEAAANCVSKFNDSTLMGKKLEVFLDPFGKKCKERVSELSADLEEEAKKEEEAKEARKRPPPSLKKKPIEDDPPPAPLPPKVPPEDLRRSSIDDPSRHRYDEDNNFAHGSHPPHPRSHGPGYNHPYPPNQFHQQQPQYPMHQQYNAQPYGSHYQQHEPHYHNSHRGHHHQQFDYNHHHPQYRPEWNSNGGAPDPKGSHHYWDNRGPRHHNPEPHLPSYNGSDHHREAYSDTSKKKKSKEVVKKISEEEPEVEDDSGSHLDLDARIAMLLHNKDSNVPSFLSMGIGSDDEEKKEEERPPSPPEEAEDKDMPSKTPLYREESSSGEEMDIDVAPLSNAPSPFLSQDEYLTWHKRSLEEKREAIRKEKEMNRQSLSKMNEMRSKMQVEEHSQLNGKAEVDDDKMSLSSLSSVENDNQHYNNNFSEHMDTQKEMRPPSPTMEDVVTHHQATLNGVLAVVIEELMRILKKDFMKRMIETTAFKTYEAWWDDNLTNFNKKEDIKEIKEGAKEKVSALSSLFHRKENFRDSLGLRGLAAMPSFRKIKKIKPPSPPHDEDSQDVPTDDEKKEDVISNLKSKKTLDDSSDSDISLEDIVNNEKLSKTKPLQSTAKRKALSALDSSSDEEEKSSKELSSEDESEEKSSSSDESSEEESSSSSSEEEDEKKAESEEDEVKSLQDESIVARDLLTPDHSERTVTPLPRGKVEAKEGLGEEEDEEVCVVDEVEKKEGVEEMEVEQIKKTDTAPETEDLTKDSADLAVAALLQLSEGSLQSSQNKQKRLDNNKKICEVQESSYVLREHSYALPWTSKENTARELSGAKSSPVKPPVVTLEDDILEIKEVKAVKVKDSRKVLTEQNLKVVPSLPRKEGFKKRNEMEEYNIMVSFLNNGVDHEDIQMMKSCYQKLLVDDQHAWLNDTHWVDHPPTETYNKEAVPTPLPQSKKKRKIIPIEEPLPLHKTGCARTEGIYKVDIKQKQKHKFTFHRLAQDPEERKKQQSLAERESSKIKATQMSVSREVRSFQRRLLTAFGNEATESELLKFNQLKFRKKLLKFGKSLIHDWGLFSMEAIAADEMVIEYVGQSVRSIIADVREIQYEKMGIGSSYLFRIDLENIIDATKCGNLARFINHSCNPNCYAKIVTVENRKKIVIYSKQPIACGEEITYDYKFPIEEEKIVCLCGAVQCKGTLN